MPQKKHCSLTLDQQVKIKEKLLENPKLTQKELADWANNEFNTYIARSTVSKILKRLQQRDVNRIQLQSKRIKNVKFPDLDQKLYQWILTEKEKICDELIVTKGKEFAAMLSIPQNELNFSNGWLQSFKQRYKLSKKMNAMTKRGALIVFEGVDRVGKTTIAKRIVDYLNEKKIVCEYLNFPQRNTAIGNLIDRFLKGETKIDDHSIHLLFSANRWECSGSILSKLHGGTTLIVDRYAFSGAAYSSAKPNIKFDWCKATEVGLPKPDLVIYLTLPEGVATQRPGYGDEIYESKAFQSVVKSNYNRLIENYWKIINANKSVDEVVNEVLPYIFATIENSSKRKVGQLWV